MKSNQLYFRSWFLLEKHRSLQTNIETSAAIAYYYNFGKNNFSRRKVSLNIWKLWNAICDFIASRYGRYAYLTVAMWWLIYFADK